MGAVEVARVTPSQATFTGLDEAKGLEVGGVTDGGVMKAPKVWMPDLAA